MTVSARKTNMESKSKPYKRNTTTAKITPVSRGKDNVKPKFIDREKITTVYSYLL